MNRRGLTLIELLIVIVIIGAMAAYAFPRIGAGIDRQNVSSARVLFVGTLARARATAIQRGTTTQLVVNNGQLTVSSFNPVTNAAETVGNVEDLTKRYGVTVSPSSLTLSFDGRGIASGAVQTTVSITKGAYGASIVISPVGRVM